MSGLVKPVSEDEIRQAISAKVGTTDFELKNVSVKPASENPLGYLGDHFRIEATVVTNGKAQDVKMFAKMVPSKCLAHYEYCQASRAFYKEIEIYKTLFKDITNSLSKTRQQKKRLPEFYYARDWELLIVEDLSIDGYYMLPERTLMDYDHVVVAIESMAKMHAGSLIFEEKLKAGKTTTLSKNFEKNGKCCIGDLYDNLIFETESTDVDGHPGKTFCEAGFKSQIPLVDLLPGYTVEQRKVIKENIASKLRKHFQFVKPSNEFKNVIIHGDLWANNLMFRKDDSGNVTNCIILDFQLARYGPPAHDVVMFLYLVQTKSFRQKHEKDLLDLYYSTLSNELKEEGVDVKRVLPLSEFNKSIEHYRESAMITSILMFQFILNPEEVTKDFLSTPEMYHKNQYEDRSEMIMASFREDEICRTRMTEAMRLLAEYYKWV